MPTAIWKSRLRSGSAHCDLEVAVEVGSAHCDLEVAVEVRQCPGIAVEVRQYPLGSGARSGGPAVPTGIWTARRRRRVRRRRRRRRTALIKSNNPHLAGGESTINTDKWATFNSYVYFHYQRGNPLSYINPRNKLPESKIKMNSYVRNYQRVL